MTNTSPFISRDVEHYRYWLRVENNPIALRDVGLAACDDLELSLALLDTFSECEAPGQLYFALGQSQAMGRQPQG